MDPIRAFIIEYQMPGQRTFVKVCIFCSFIVTISAIKRSESMGFLNLWNAVIQTVVKLSKRATLAYSAAGT